MLAVLIGLVGLLGLPASADAARDLEVSIMDDQLLLGQPQAQVDREMATFVSLGVDRLRISAFWEQLAPSPASFTKPAGFNGANPNDPRYGWAPLDRVVLSAARHGLRVMVTISTPAPVWATGRNDRLWKPNIREFADFSEAVARRYSVFADQYGIGNEPNQGVWLKPQREGRALVAPHFYRAMVQASYPRIKAVDPDSAALIGELASTGRTRGRASTRNIRPLTFLRAMACRDRRYRPIRRGRCRGFRAVPIDALGHHPYQLLLAPFMRSIERDDAAINDGRRLVRLLDRLVRNRSLRPGRGRRIPIFYTEFGYQTNPPDPFASVSLRQQRLYLQQAAYVAWRTPRVRGVNQFRLTDGGLTGIGVQRFREFQSGLMFRDRRRKPAYSIFPHPFVIVGDRFWGQVRRGGAHSVRVERRAPGGSVFRRVAQVLTNRRGYFTFRLPGRRRGAYRYTYTDPPGTSGIVRVRR
jgi:hypothetical protein